jgi:uncharacterized membrane protein
MHEIRTFIEIESTPEEIWTVHIDFAAYAKWNSFIRSIKDIAENRKTLKTAGGQV